VAYRTVIPVNLDQEKVARILAGESDAILFFSPTAVEHFVAVIGQPELCKLQEQSALTAVGPITASALKQAGVKNMIVAADTSADDVIAALERYFAGALKVSAAGAVQE
jgi:uroporphyrinogen-III synthase